MEKLLSGLRAVAEHTRLRLLTILCRHELTVSEITYILDQSQPRVSRHLKLMCDAGVLDRIQEGAWVFYRVTDRHPGRQLAQSLIELLNTEDAVLKRDELRLQQVKQDHRQQAEAYFQENAADWDELRRLYVSEQEVEQAMLAAVEGGSIDYLLDLGTGTGRMLEVFGDKVQKGMGIDINREMLAIARAKLEAKQLTHCQVRHGDIHNVPLPGEQVDLVTIHHVLHYLNNPEMVINESARLLKSKGRLLVVDFAPHELELLRQAHAHRRLGFSEKEITHWCDNAGLKVIKMQHLQPSAQSADSLTVTLWMAEK